MLIISLNVTNNQKYVDDFAFKYENREKHQNVLFGFKTSGFVERMNGSGI